MRTLSQNILFLAIMLLTALPRPAISGIEVVIDPWEKHQIFEGWGTSLCWWAVQAGKWSEANRRELIGAIVDPDTGLGYNCFRYNIGGGDQPGHDHLSEARAVPGFKADEIAAYDWNSDQYQRNVLLGIAARGEGLIFEAFSNSPPWWMTVSGCVSGNVNGADNLKSDHFTAFAEYLASVAGYYRETWGITFRTVEPFNEPSSGYWKINGGQEGCGFKKEQSAIIRELGKQLVAKGLFGATMVSAADETSLDQTVKSFASYDDSAFGFLSQINSHSYGGWQSRRSVDSLAKALKMNLWQSESGPLGKGNDPSDITMWMSHVIIQDLRIMKPNAWIDWQVCDPVADWMTIALDHSRQRFSYSKRYYMHAAFSRFIRPGSLIIGSSDTNSVAALAPGTGDLIVVLRNNAGGSEDYTIDLSRFAAAPGGTARIHRFSLPGSLTREPDAAIDVKRLSLSAPGRSITTCVIPGMGTGVRDRYGTIANTPEYRTFEIGDTRLNFRTYPGKPLEITVYNCLGRRMRAERYGPNSFSGITLVGFPLSARGMYFVTHRQGNITQFRNIIISR